MSTLADRIRTSAGRALRDPRGGLSWKDPSVRGIALPLIGLIALIIFFGLESPRFLTADNFSDILRNGAVLLVVAVGATWVILMGSIDLSVGANAVLAGLITAILIEESGLAVWLAVIIGIAAAFASGILNGLLFAYARLPSFLVTLGMSLAVTGIGLVLVGGRTIQVFEEGFTSISQGTLLGSVPNMVVWSLLIWALAIGVGIWTRFGRYAYMIGGGEVVARLSGVPVRRYKLYAFAVSGFLAGLGGIFLTSRLSAGSPEATSNLALQSIAAVVMGGTALTGGVGGVHRTMIGVLVISILENGLTGMGVSPFERLIVQGLVVIIAVAMTIDRSKLTVLK